MQDVGHGRHAQYLLRPCRAQRGRVSSHENHPAHTTQSGCKEVRLGPSEG